MFMPKPPIPPPPQPLTLAIKDLKLSLPLFAFALLVGGAVVLVRYPEQPRQTAEPTNSAEVPPAWAVDVRPMVLSSMHTAATGALPEPLEGQRRPPCDPDLERELRGACWIPVAVTRCPPGKAFVNDSGPRADGKCYSRSMQAARGPTSGEPRPGSIADP